MRKLILIFLVLSVTHALNAQTKDVQLWAGPSLKYNILKKLRLDFEQQVRFNQNISNYEFTYSEFSLKYEVFKYLDVKTSFRQSFMPAGTLNGTALSDNDRSRFSLDASTSDKVFKTGIKVGYRIRYQNSWENNSNVSSNYIRNKLELEYNLSKLVDPYFNYESFYRLNKLNQFRQDRYTLGLTWRVNKKIDIDSFYRFQKEKNVKHPETDYIIGIGVSYEFN
ncbi:MAG: DUF2490 domain-containing protein [Bacteroidales bacterium]|nr:DUF2490 domain-containing protein [Bacteroidales bacterium]MCB9013894.1 DUF2490 domain-containing protein [Bacteroidales bacterium]